VSLILVFIGRRISSMAQLSVNPWTFLIVDHHANFPKPPAATQGSGLSLAIGLFVS